MRRFRGAAASMRRERGGRKGRSVGIGERRLEHIARHIGQTLPVG